MDIQGSVQVFFGQNSPEFPLFEAASARIRAMIPGAAMQVQKTQIAFKTSRAFCWIWLPIRKGIKGRPEHYILLSFAYKEKIQSERIEEAVEARPGQWTHHVIIGQISELDQELLTWIRWADQWRNPAENKSYYENESSPDF